MDILIYGFGKMASAMVEGWLRADMEPACITAYNPRAKKAPAGVAFVTEVPERAFDLVVLGFKPHMLPDIAPKMSRVVGKDTAIVSILAGVTLEMLREAYPQTGAHVRFMPNLAVALGKSPNLLVAHGLDETQRSDITRLARMLGSAEWLEDEGLFDLATALAGSGPAFVFRFIDALGAAGQELGLPHPLSARLALAMVEGAAMLAANAEFSPAELADRVASPGGMTREGLNVLDDDKALESLLIRTLRATRDRGAELAAQARAQG